LFLDGGLRIKMFTPATTRLFNLIPSDTGRPIKDLSINFIGYDLLADARAAAREGSVIEREVQHASGSLYLIRVMPYRTQHDQVDGVVVTFGDVTNLRRAEKRIRRLATAMVASNDAVILFDLKGNILDWNRGAGEMYGWTEAEALKMSFRELVPADKAAETLDLMKRLLSCAPIPSFETQRLTRDGKVLDVWLTISCVLDEEGKVEGFASTERDITDRKRRERELKSLNETLEQRVSQRTGQLRRLASELTLSEHRERQRLALILHDGLQQILVGAKFQIALFEHNQDAQSATAQITELIDEAIETSRSLTAQLSPPILTQGGLIAGMEWLARWMHDKHGLSVNLQIHEIVESPSENLTIFLFHATRELLFNVIKHSEVMTARVEVIKLDGNIQIEVADDGVGFDPNKLDSTDDLSGIGLFGIRERLRMLGGRLEIDSSPGRGSRFRLIAPYSAQAAEVFPDLDQPTVSVLIKSGGNEEGEATKRIRIILVDDHIILRQGLAGLLRAEEGMELVGEASDGAAAVNMVREVRPDVVLMDVSMPGMNGIEATQIIHREFPDIHVIGLSMFQEGEQAVAMRDAGAVSYATKSGSSEAILSLIRSCCPK
jgi:PAS domain S-box-containing protein